MSVSTMMMPTICRLAVSRAPTKSLVGVRLIASQGCPKLFGNRVNDALHSAPVSGEWKIKLSSLV